METTRTWRSRKKSSDKSALAAEVVNDSSRLINGKMRMCPVETGVNPERARKSLNEKLASVLLDCQAKDPPLMDHAEIPQEHSGKEEVEAEEMFLKTDSHESLEFFQEEHGERVDGDLLSASIEIKRERKVLEENLTEMKKRLESLAAENSHLKNFIMVKEHIEEDLHKHKSQVESEFNALMARLDSIEKENAFLRYEYHVLEKEFQIRTEEMEYNRRSADLAQKQHLKSLNMIVELEAECQRLRLLVRKKVPGRVAMVQKFRGEVEERRTEMTRKNKNPTRDLVVRDEFQNKRIENDLLVKQLGNVKEENKILKEILEQKMAEINELLKVQKSVELVKSYEVSPKSNFDIGGEDGVSSCGSWANASVSEFKDEKFKNLRGQRINGASEMSLYMDDFAEMEKFAVVCAEKSSKDDENEKPFDWLQVVLNAISKQQRISKQGIRELLEDIRIALGCVNDKKTEKMNEESIPLCITWKSPSGSPKLGSMTKDEIKKHLGMNKQETEDEEVVAESLSDLKIDSFRSKSTKHDVLEENLKLKEEIMNIARRNKELMSKHGEIETKNGSLETELKNLRESKDEIEDQMENQKSINEDLDTQLTVTRAKLNEVLQKFSSLEVELDYRNSCCEELEGTCLELQLQLQSVAKEEPSKYLINQEGKESQNGLEMTVASIKLAECQETILNLRRQLKALTLPTDSTILCTETANSKKLPNKRCSLRDRMVAEDGTKESSCKTEEKSAVSIPSDDDKNSRAMIVYTRHVYDERKDAVENLVVVQSKKLGFGFLKKLLSRKKKASSKKCLALVKV